MLELPKEEYPALHSSGELIDDDAAQHVNPDQNIDATIAGHTENVCKMIWDTALDDDNLPATVLEIDFVERSLGYAQSRVE
jgi:hypothetical protein